MPDVHVEELHARIAKSSTEIELQRELLKRLEQEESAAQRQILRKKLRSRCKKLARRQLNTVFDPVAPLPLETSKVDGFFLGLPDEVYLLTKLLKNLENKKSDVQYELNAALDPVGRLPFELSSEIFLQSLPAFAEPGAQAVPILLLKICHAWTEIALSTPALWASIQLHAPEFNYTQAFKDGAHVWLQRACNRPLSIALRGIADYATGATDIVWRHGHRLRHLELRHELNNSYYELVDLLGSPGPGPLLGLKTLVIRGCTLRYDEQAYSGPQILKLLGLASNLAECIFDRVEFMDGWENLSGILVLPALRRLSLGGPYSDHKILTWLSLPGLVALSVAPYSAAVDELLLLLKRSSPPLRELEVNIPDAADCMRLHECLRLVPTLTRFEMWQSGFSPAVLDLFLATLVTSRPRMLPELRILVLHYDGTLSPSFWMTLLYTLAVALRYYSSGLLRRF
ncbi:hypothetical protein DFH06DRAFT_1412932 [Mycena polygramma]|nr:hypothetical protein DFH06DRAFT_1412932 [Mycena polygramma]